MPPAPQQNAKPSRQFSLRKLLLIVTGLSFGFGSLAAGGSYAIALLIIVLAVCAWRQRSSLSYVEILVVLGILITLAALLLPAVDTGRTSARRMACTINLKQIALALHSYEATYGTFPPAYIADAEGKPMHCWRVLILPFLEQQQLYDQYRFDEPWDGPNNSKLAAQVPAVNVYRCPSDDQPGNPLHTSYLAVLGPATAWPGEVGRKLAEFQDGTSRTILVVEVAQSGIHWMEPRDLDLSQMNLQLNAPTGQSPRSGHPGGIVVAFADGHVQFLENSLTAEQLRALLTVDGQEPVDLENW